MLHSVVTKIFLVVARPGHRPPPPQLTEDPKRALVHALQNDLSRMSVLLERLDELLSA